MHGNTFIKVQGGRTKADVCYHDLVRIVWDDKVLSIVHLEDVNTLEGQE